MIHGPVIGHGTDDHKCKNYKMQVMKIGCIITRMKRHVTATPKSVEDYPRKEMLKANRFQASDKFNELIDHFALLNQHEHLNNLEMEGRHNAKKQYNL